MGGGAITRNRTFKGGFIKAIIVYGNIGLVTGYTLICDQSWELLNVGYRD